MWDKVTADIFWPVNNDNQQFGYNYEWQQTTSDLSKMITNSISTLWVTADTFWPVNNDYGNSKNLDTWTAAKYWPAMYNDL